MDELMEKVIVGLTDAKEIVSAVADDECMNRDNYRCLCSAETLIDDAIAFLKAQEPRVMTLEEVLEWAETPAEKRDPIFFEQKEGKGPNGWICNSVCPKDYYLCCLDKDARCWTSRPTDEQREAVKWE